MVLCGESRPRLSAGEARQGFGGALPAILLLKDPFATLYDRCSVFGPFCWYLPAPACGRRKSRSLCPRWRQASKVPLQPSRACPLTSLLSRREQVRETATFGFAMSATRS